MEYYNEISSGYDELYSQEQRKKLAIVKDNTRIANGTKILDVGCGTGISSDFNCFVVGIDTSIGLLRLNKGRLKVNGRAEELPFRSSSFDIVISLTAIHNFSGVEAALFEIARVSNKAVISVLKRAGKFSLIYDMLQRIFEVDMQIDEGLDVIFFCTKRLCTKSRLAA